MMLEEVGGGINICQEVSYSHTPDEDWVGVTDGSSYLFGTINHLFPAHSTSSPLRCMQEVLTHFVHPCPVCEGCAENSSYNFALAVQAKT